MFYSFEHFACQKDQDKQCRPISDIFPVNFSDKHFVNSSPDNQQLFENRKRSVQNFRTFTTTLILLIEFICSTFSVFQVPQLHILYNIVYTGFMEISVDPDQLAYNTVFTTRYIPVQQDKG